MENDKLDRLFREKVEGYELPPSSDAWASIARQRSTGNSAALYLKIAAALVVILSAALIIRQHYQQLPMQYAVIDHPVIIDETTSLRLYAFESAPVSDETEKQNTAISTYEAMKTPPQVATEEVRAAPVVEPEMPVLSIDHKRVLLAVEQIVPPEVIKPATLETGNERDAAVIIRYYAESSAPDSAATEKKGLGTLWAKAQTFSPGDFLADLRTAKDDLFRSKRMN